jgi:5-methylcytosine-specific restriction endonuclease McrA
MPHKDPEQRRAWAAEYRRKNRALMAEYQKRYIEKNADVRKLSLAKYSSTEKSIAAKARYREKNRESLRAAGREYVKSNRDKQAAALAKYRAAKLRATPSWASLFAIKDIYKESRRLTVSTGIKHHVDHVIPLVSDEVCGLHVEWNLIIITARENQVKGNRDWPRD